MNRAILYSCVFLIFLCVSCFRGRVEIKSGLNKSDFHKELNGQTIDLFVLKNKKGMEVCITNYGARVVSLVVPDKDGKMEDIVCGFSTISDYLDIKQNFGATIGRYIGKIADATFTLDSVTYHLTVNTDTHNSHGGYPGFAAKIWNAQQIGESTLALTLLSPDGDNGFPGNLNVKLIYKVTEDNELDISYEAVTDKPTVVNLSHHSFFNLSGDLNTTIEDHILYINASNYTPFASTKIVTGDIFPVKDTPFDFTSPHTIGARIDEKNPQLQLTKGYDHNWVLDTKGDDGKLAARLTDPKSGRMLEVYTNEPGLQVYTANGLKGKMVGKGGIAYPFRNSVCLETQHFQDSPNKPQFPSTVLRPGETYRSHCIYRFTTISD